MAPDDARIPRNYDEDEWESRLERTLEAPKESPDSEKQKRTFFSNRYFQAGAAVLALGAIGVGVVWWLHARKYENTDDAFVDAHIVRLSPQVAGRVTLVHVTDNQLVHKGDPLLDIDAADFDAKLVQAKAQQAQAETQLLQNEATEKGAEDFSLLAKVVPGMFYFLGITPPDEDPRTAPSNHSPQFHVHEPALKYGVRSLAYLAIDYLRRG